MCPVNLCALHALRGANPRDTGGRRYAAVRCYELPISMAFARDG